MYFDVHPSVMCHIKINKNRVDTWFHALVIDQILRCGVLHSKMEADKCELEEMRTK